MNDHDKISAQRACEALTNDYGNYADNWKADALAELFTVDGVFDRLGQQITGRAAIRAFIAERPRDVWQRHHASNFRFELAPDGRSARARSDLTLERGKAGDSEVQEVVHAHYDDHLVLTADGWRIKRRTVELAS